VKSPGRCEVLHRDPTIIVDAAHNPHGASAIADTIQTEFTFDEVIGVFAPMGDKDVRGILLELEQVMDSVIVTANSSARSMKVEELEKIAAEIFGSDRVFAAPTVTDAIDKAVKDCIRPLSEDTIGILITGSVVTVGEARAIVRKKFAKEEK
jgi:dihydrofolate synthase/folylpolyglutamate synthase